MRFEYRLTSFDRVVNRRDYRLGVLRRPVWYAVSLLLMLFSTVYVFRDPLLLLWMLPFTAVLALFTWEPLWLVRFNAFMSRPFDAVNPFSSRWIEFNDDGIDAGFWRARQTIPWGNVKSVEVTRHFLYIKCRWPLRIEVPLHAFGTEENRAEAFEYMRAHLRPDVKWKQ